MESARTAGCWAQQAGEAGRLRLIPTEAHDWHVDRSRCKAIELVRALASASHPSASSHSPPTPLDSAVSNDG
jgi:hypothetical protein